MRRIRVKANLLASLVVGVLVGSWVPLAQVGCNDCGPEHEPASLYEITDSRPGWVPGSGRIRVSEDTLLVTYQTIDGSSWEVEFQVSELFE